MTSYTKKELRKLLSSPQPVLVFDRLFKYLKQNLTKTTDTFLFRTDNLVYKIAKKEFDKTIRSLFNMGLINDYVIEEPTLNSNILSLSIGIQFREHITIYDDKTKYDPMMYNYPVFV